MMVATIGTAAGLYLAGLCWTAWRDHLEHLEWLRRRRLTAMAKQAAEGYIAAMGPALEAFGAAAVEMARRWEQAFQQVQAAMVTAVELVATMVPPCIECGVHHPDAAFTGPCQYGVDGCVESAGCGSILVMHTVDHTDDVGPSETIHQADTPPPPAAGPWVVAVDPAVIDALPSMPVWAEIDYGERVNTRLRDDWGSRLQTPSLGRDGASGMTLDELLSDIDDAIGDRP